MVSKKRQKRSPKKSPHNEDVYLNDLQVEIKQEEELIIEDADQHVQWRFIGLDEDVNEEGADWEGHEFQQGYFQNQFESGNHNHAHSASCDEVIEISDDENENYQEGVREVVEVDASCKVLITNEPLQDSLIEANGLHNQPSPSEEANNETSVCLNPEIGEDASVSSCIVLNIKNGKEVLKKKAGNSIKEAVVQNHEPENDNVDSLNVGLMNELMCRKLIKMVCHICGTTFQYNVYSWLSHMKQLHPNSLREISSKYKPHSDLVVICKLCKMQVTPKINHSLHYITRHLEPKPQIFLCTFCNYTDISLINLQKHQLEKHPSVISKREKCPKCNESFKDSTALEFHFMSVHVREFNAKFVYRCHLCDSAQFESSKNKLYSHLIDTHKLANWKIMNFRKIDNGAYLSCRKCYKIFVKTNVQHLLGHYLTHEDKSTWSCKFCKSTNHFKDWPLPHLCKAMRKFYEAKCTSTGINVDGISNEDEQYENIKEHQVQRSVSWNEFEAYIEHVCPFCSKGFHKFEYWRLHVRELHYIHTLEGLNMTVIPDESDKLLCLQCDKHVTKSAIELHKHRFQHLPHEPYKCRHCATCLPTYNKALCHVQKNCLDNNEECVEPTPTQNIITKSESVSPQLVAAVISISCTLCNNKRFLNFTQLSKHITDVHDDFDKYFTKATKDRSRACKICQNDMKHNKISELIGHYLQHLNERPFKCQKCLRSYPTYKTALKHAQVYHFENTTADIKEYIQKCSIKQEEETKPHSELPPVPPIPTQLQKDTQPPTTLKDASTSLHQDNDTKNSSACALKPSSVFKVVETTNKVFKTFEKYITYTCPECNEFFSSHTKWDVHITSKHTFYIGTTIQTREGKIKCRNCNINVPTSLSKQHNHQLLHMPYRPFICALCFVHFSVISNLYKHLRNAHFCQRRFPCALCPKILHTDVERLEHAKKVHPRTDWPKNMCTKCYNIIDDMDVHLRTNHLTHQRKHRCENCGIYFEYSKELETHVEKIHSRKNKVVDTMSSLESSRTLSRLGKRKLRSLSSEGFSNNVKKTCSSSVAPIKSARK